MIILATSGFNGEILVSDTQEDYGNAVELKYFIDKYAPELLVSCLGRALFEELKGQLKTDGTIKDDAPDYWKAFASKAEEPLRYYCFYFYHSNVGSQVQIEPKNATNANKMDKLVEVWNEFVKLYQGSVCHSSHPLVYDLPNGGEFIDWVGNGAENTLVSLVELVRTTPELAYNASKLYRLKNRFDL